MFPPNVLAPELVQCTFLQRHLSHSLDCLRFLTFFLFLSYYYLFALRHYDFTSVL